MLHIYHKGIIFAAEIKQNTNSIDPRRSLKSATKTMKTTITIASHYDTMRDQHLVMDLDKLAALFQELDYHSLQYIVDTDDYNDRNGHEPTYFTTAQLRKLKQTLGTDFYDKIELPENICGYNVPEYTDAWYCLDGGDMVECDKKEDVYYLIYTLLREDLDLVAITDESAINEAKEHFYLLKEGNDYENAEIKKMYAIVDYPEPGVTHTRGYLLLDNDWNVEF